MTIAITQDGTRVELKSDGTWVEINGSAESRGEFRGVPWGASMQDVRAREASPAKFEGEDVLVFPERLSDMDVAAVYVFVAGRLVRAKYMFEEEYTNANRYIESFYQVKSLFAGKYGDPREDRTIWRDDLFRDDHDAWGRAVERGDLTFIAEWATDETEIGLILHGNDYESHLAVEYNSVALKPWAESLQNDAQHDLI